MKYQISNEQLRKLVQNFIEKLKVSDRIVSVDAIIDTESYPQHTIVVNILLFDNMDVVGIMKGFRRHNISEKVTKAITKNLINFFGQELTDRIEIHYFWTKEKQD